MEHQWDQPLLAHFLRRPTSYARVLLFDKRGTALSDRTTGVPTLEECMDDIRAVMDAEGSERAALIGHYDLGAHSAMFAATTPFVVSSTGTVASRSGPRATDSWRRSTARRAPSSAPLQCAPTSRRSASMYAPGCTRAKSNAVGSDVRGIAVHIGARVAALAGPGEVLASNTVKDLVVGSGIGFEARGSHTLKGVPDEWLLFAVRN
jgi:pimeloyl-ACP methyl ester carboxylesterase